MIELAELGYFVGVGGDDDAVELRADYGRFVDPGKHGPPCDGTKNFARQAG